MTRRAALLAVLASFAAPRAVRADEVPDLYVHGRVLTIGHGYLVFTTGDAVRLGPATVVPPGVGLGTLVRVTIAQTTRAIVRVEAEPGDELSGEIDAAYLPRQYVVVDPPSAQDPTRQQHSAAGGPPVTVTIGVTVPGNTPLGDDVYLSTDRTNFNPYELRMTRLDGQRWLISLQLAEGSTLRYLFSRGSFATVERDRSGGIANPHSVTAERGAQTHDTVARWADIS